MTTKVTMEYNYQNNTSTPTSINLTNFLSTTVAGEPEIKLYKVVRFYVMCIILPLVILVGIIGNVLSFIVWWKEGSKTSTNFLLMALSAVDSLFLITYFCYQSVSYFLNYYYLLENPSQVYMNHLFWITKLMAVYTIVIIAVDRCIAVCLPLKASLWTTVRRTKIIFTVMVLCSVLYNLPRLIKSPYTSHRNKIYSIIYLVGAYIAIYFVFPLLALMVSNSILISNIKAADRKRAQISQSSSYSKMQAHSNTQNITRMLIAVITCFILCEMPGFIYSVLSIIYRTTPLTKDQENVIVIYKIFTELLFACNSSANFFIYCLKGTKFRKILKRVLKCESRPMRTSDSLLGNTDTTCTAETRISRFSSGIRKHSQDCKNYVKMEGFGGKNGEPMTFQQDKSHDMSSL